MGRITTDANDPDLTRKNDESPASQADVYLVLSDEERAKGFIRPVRTAYRHQECDGVTTMSKRIAETYARDPKFYDGTYCVSCRKHRPVGEFTWDGTDVIVGT